jgi:quercetin dioxygenase-like cupin family protein
MNRATFEQKLKTDGYEPVERHMDANHFNPEHAHEFDARVMVLDGEMTITRNGTPQVFRPGDVCEMAAGTPHSEQCGAKGASYLAGRRFK